MKASASRGSSAMVYNGGLIALNFSQDITAFGPSGLGPWLCTCFYNLCAICCWVWSIWRNTSVWAAIKASAGVICGGAGRGPSPLPPTPESHSLCYQTSEKLNFH
jgi:hypothetical protein